MLLNPEIQTTISEILRNFDNGKKRNLLNGTIAKRETKVIYCPFLLLHREKGIKFKDGFL